MIYSGCVLKLSDNSSVSYVKCFNVDIKSKIYIGSLFYISVKLLKSKDKFRKGDTSKGMVIRQKKPINRYTGNFLIFDLNEIIFFNGKNEILGTRIFGLLPLELRKKRNLKFLTLSCYFV